MLSPFLSLAFAAASVAAQVPDAARFDAVIEEARKAFQTPGVVVGIVKDDQVVHLKGYGAKRLGETAAATPDTRFAIGSTTKAFTATALALLVDDGKVAWDDPVRKHYPTFRLSDPLANENVTLRDLVSHRTGLSRHDGLWYGTTLSRDEIIRRIGLVPLTKPYREAYQYQNIMFLTAGQVVGRVAGTTWEGFVSERILKPLGMTNTDFSVNDAQKAPDYATPHAKKKDVVTVIPWRNIDNIGPAGSINSSARDMTKWVRMQLAGGTAGGTRVVSAKELAETHTPQMVVREEGLTKELSPETNISVYGLGWRIEDYRGRHLVSHGGAIDGFRAHVALLPKEKIGMVILSNLGGTGMPEALRNSLCEVLLGLPAKDWNQLYTSVAARREAATRKEREEREKKRVPNTKPSRELAEYAGAFENPAYGTLRVSVETGALALDWERWHIPLNHFHFDTFQGPDDDTPLANTQVTFRLNVAGEPAAVLFTEQEFKRVRK